MAKDTYREELHQLASVATSHLVSVREGLGRWENENTLTRCKDVMELRAECRLAVEFLLDLGEKLAVWEAWSKS